MKQFIVLLITATLLVLSCNSTHEDHKKPNPTKGEESPTTFKDSKMERLQFTIKINASPERVYHDMIDNEKFKQWTSPFSPTSYFQGTWEAGSNMQFRSTDEDGNVFGMLSRIKENKPNQFISIEHYGLIQNGKEITEGDDVEALKGSLENYTFRPNGDHMELIIDTDIFIELKDYFMETWPQALDVLKEICETPS